MKLVNDKNLNKLAALMSKINYKYEFIKIFSVVDHKYEYFFIIVEKNVNKVFWEYFFNLMTVADFPDTYKLSCVDFRKMNLLHFFSFTSQKFKFHFLDHFL